MQLWSFSKWFHRFLEPWTLLKCVIPQFDVTFAASPNQNVHKQLDRCCISCWLLTWYFQTSSFKKLKINIINIAQATQSASQRQQQKTHSVTTDFNTVTMEEDWFGDITKKSVGDIMSPNKLCLLVLFWFLTAPSGSKWQIVRLKHEKDLNLNLIFIV